ncbi:MAG: nucleotidyltransferase family protein [Cyanobacteria bacterium SZAS-4]|nr:nucleotidyltransferase family protein [Cyanobacteria bacterium SZAS-4]
MATKIVAAILAAGASSRFGSPKQLAKLGNKTLIDVTLDALDSAGLEHICVVLGCNFETINDHLRQRKGSSGTDFHILQNVEWSNGLSSSIQCAVKFAIAEDATHVLLLACDQPFVDSSLVQKLLDSANALSHKTDIIACKYENSAGIPAVFPAIFFDHLLKLEGDKGAKSIILTSSTPVLIDFPNGSRDIDFREDLNKLETSAAKD